MSNIVYDDFLINFDMGFDKAIRCHGNTDFKITVQGDIELTSNAAQAILQRLWLLMITKEGEVPGNPNLGFAIYRYYFKPNTPSVIASLQREIEYQLKHFIPELGVRSVKCESATGSNGRVDGVKITILTQNFGRINLLTTRGDMEAYNEQQEILYNVMDFIQRNNMQ